MVILGHSNISVTLGIYTQGDEDSRRNALDRLDQALRLPLRITAPVRQTTPLLSLSLTPRSGRSGVTLTWWGYVDLNHGPLPYQPRCPLW